jgi:hypothetical protein
VAASVVHLQGTDDWIALGVCDSAVEGWTGLLTREIKAGIGRWPFVPDILQRGPILFMLCIAAGAGAGMMLFESMVVHSEEASTALHQLESSFVQVAGKGTCEDGGTCDANTPRGTGIAAIHAIAAVWATFWHRLCRAFVPLAMSGAALGAALAGAILSTCRIGKCSMRSRVAKSLDVPRDLCVLQTVRRASKNGSSSVITITEASFESVRCPAMRSFVRACNGPGAGFQLESISCNGWPASRVTMVADFDPSDVNRAASQALCLDRLSALVSLASFISGNVESWSERVLLRSGLGSDGDPLGGGSGGSGGGGSGKETGRRHLQVVGAQKAPEAIDIYEEEEEGNDANAMVVVRERIVTQSSSPIAPEENMREGAEVMRYQRCWDRRRGCSSWVLLPPASSYSSNFHEVPTSVHYPWLRVLEDARQERKMQNKSMQWYVRKRDILLQEEYDENLRGVDLDRRGSGRSSHQGYRAYVDPLGFIHERDEDDFEESLTRKLNFGQLPHRKWDPYAWMGGLTRVPTGGLKGTAPTSLGASIKGMFRRPIGDIFGDFVSSSSTTVSEAVLPPEPCSRLERFARSWVYAPQFLPQAATATDPVKRFELVMAFAVAGLHFGAMPTRPFEPLLGETLQAALSDGSQIYCEQVSSLPSMFAFEVVSKAMKISNRKQSRAKNLRKNRRRRRRKKKKKDASERLVSSNISGKREPSKVGRVHTISLVEDVQSAHEYLEDESESDLGSDDSGYTSSAASNGQQSDEEEYSDEGDGGLNAVVNNYKPESDGEGSAESSSDSDNYDADSLYLSQGELRRLRRRKAQRREARKEARRLRAEREAWTISGQLENEMQYTLKSWNTLQKGTIRVSFHDGFVDYTMPHVQVSFVDVVVVVVGWGWGFCFFGVFPPYSGLLLPWGGTL